MTDFMSDPSSYAVLELNGSQSAGELFTLLISHGYSYVTFVPHLHEHPTMRAFTEERDRQRQCRGECQLKGKALLIDNATLVAPAAVIETTNKVQSAAAEYDDIIWEDDFVDEKPQAFLHRTESHVQMDQVQTIAAMAEADTTVSTSADENISRLPREAAQPVKMEPTFSHDVDENSSEYQKSFMDDQMEGDYSQATAGSSSSGQQLDGYFEEYDPEENKQTGERSKTAVNIIIKRGKANYKHGKPGVKPADSDFPTEKCQLCHQWVRADRPDRTINNMLIRHAKIHCDQHQYSCPADGCGLSSSRIDNIIKHMRTQHNLTGQPINNLTPELQEAWIKAFELCFPKLNAKQGDLEYVKNRFAQKTKRKEVKKSLPKQQCMMCLEQVHSAPPHCPSYKGVTYLLRHAKNHCEKQQFVCSVDGCGYSHSRNGARVVAHMKSIHNIVGGQPFNMMTPELKQAWIETFKQCFPALQHKISEAIFRPRPGPSSLSEDYQLEDPDDCLKC